MRATRASRRRHRRTRRSDEPPSHSALRNAFAALLALSAAALLLGGCASQQGVQPAASPEPVHEVPPEIVKQRAIERAQSLIVRAREEARVGLLDAAERSWDEAIELLRPLAEGDARIERAIAEIAADRDRLLLAAVRGREALGPVPDPLESEAEQALVGPEPQLDPAHADEVQDAAEEVEPDYPVEVNDRVLAWLEVYRRDGKLGDWFARSLARSGRYEERFREIFAEEGIPQDLIYLAHVESAFKTSAYSHAHARGIFQFIASTGRRYGMRIDWWIDERGDPEKSCRAAANYLRDLYDEFGDWYLALAAYNGGSGRVRSAIRRSGSRDFWVHARRRLLYRETRNYVPAILAATLISKNPKKFGFGDVEREQPVPYEVVSVPDQADIEVLAKAAGTEPGVLRELNPALRRGQTPPNYPGYPLKVPQGHADGFAEKLAQIPKDEWIVKQLHRVRRGDTLYELARRHGTTVRAIQAANNLGRRTLLSIGQVLEVPRGPGGGAAWAPPTSGGTYKVRRGDTLGRIARWYGVSVRDLQRWNELGRSTRIYPGQRLKVGAAGSASSSQRSSDVSGRTYRVRRGDSAWKIARRYGLPLNRLLRANGLGRHSVLQPGQKLVLPGVPEAAAARNRSSRPADGAGYRVRQGDNPWTIARRHDIELDALLAANGLHRGSRIQPGDTLVIPGREDGSSSSNASSASAPPAEPRKAADTGGEESTAYRVRRGDNAWTIARRHGVEVDALLAANGLHRGSVLKPGQELVIPGEGAVATPQVHVVRRGENLYRIARRYGMTVDQLCDINGLSRRSVIHPGDRLTVR